VLSNYGTHYVGGTRRGHISADYFGAFATHIAYLLEADRADPPFVGILSNGTSGDVNTVDFTKPRRKGDAPYQRIKLIAEDVADSAQVIENTIQYHDHVPLAVAKAELTLAVRKPDAALLQWANETYVGEKAPPGKTNLSRPQIYARENLHLSRYPDELSIMLQVIRIGDLAITAVPCETFAETGLSIKEASPFPATFTIELANGFFGYLPTPQQHIWGGYETWPARSSLLEVQAEPKIRKTILRLLKQVHATP
jgi:neutral ceramidase